MKMIESDTLSYLRGYCHDLEKACLPNWKKCDMHVLLKEIQRVLWAKEYEV